MAQASKFARRPRKNKKMRYFPQKNFTNFLLKLIVQKVWLVKVNHLWEETMLHQLQVTIDLHKSKLYVKTKQKFSKDINSFASKVDKR